MKNLKEFIFEAEEKGVALGHFNISNTDGIWGVFGAARKLNLPVVIGVSEGERDFIGIRQVKAIIDSIKDEYNYPIFLNADHTYSFERVKEVVDAGYDSFIIDGAKVSLEENIEMTKKSVEYARSVNPDILVEAEIGYIGQSSKVWDDIPEGVSMDEKVLTDPEMAEDFVKKTGVDLLAPAVGNMHGMLRTGKNPKLNIERIRKIREKSGVPLVLHGGSGSSEEDFKEAVKAGISTVHVSTEIRVAYRDAIKKFLEENPDEVAPYKFLKDAVLSIQDVVEKKLKIFNNLD